MSDAYLLDSLPQQLGSDMPARDLWIGFDLGGTKMLAALCDERMEVIARKRKSTKGHEGAEAGIDRVKNTIEKVVEEAGVSLNRVAGIGIGCPGPLDLNEGIVLQTPNLGWKNVPICELLEKEFSIPTVLVNDVDAGVYGEYRLGAAQKAQCVVGLFPGTGIGGGCVYNGQILRGPKLSCFEVGHMRVVPEGDFCGCGRRGCLETIASRLAISSEVAKAAYRGQAPNLLELAGTDLSNIRSGVLAEAIEKGDKIVEKIVRNAAKHLGVAAGGLINLLCPDVILLGGGLVEALPKLYIEEVRKAAEDYSMPAYHDSFKVVAATLGDDAAAKGAAVWAQATIESRR